jgi:hypothetical protein
MQDALTMVRKPRWSFKEDRRLMELARSSKSLEDVAKATGRSPDRIRKMAMRLGLSIKSRSRKK